MEKKHRGADIIFVCRHFDAVQNVVVRMVSQRVTMLFMYASQGAVKFSCLYANMPFELDVHVDIPEQQAMTGALVLFVVQYNAVSTEHSLRDFHFSKSRRVKHVGSRR